MIALWCESRTSAPKLIRSAFKSPGDTLFKWGNQIKIWASAMHIKHRYNKQPCHVCHNSVTLCHCGSVTQRLWLSLSHCRCHCHCHCHCRSATQPLSLSLSPSLSGRGGTASRAIASGSRGWRLLLRRRCAWPMLLSSGSLYILPNTMTYGKTCFGKNTRK